jgi:hypothetical protein
MPKLRRIFSLVSRPFWWPMTMHGSLRSARGPDDRGIVGVGAIAMQLLEMGEQRLDVVERVRPLRMARHLRHLPRA